MAVMAGREGELKSSGGPLGRVTSWELNINDPPNIVDVTTFKTLPRREWSATVTGFAMPTTARDWMLAEFRSALGCDIILPRKWWQWIVPVEFYYQIDNVKAVPDGEDDIVVSGNCYHKEPRRRFVIPGRRLARRFMARVGHP